MTRHELADRLNHLDPGGTLHVDEGVLAQMFGGPTLSDEVVEAIEAFALEHRCSFAWHEHGVTAPCFEKDDIF
jgi:hypothetical protein